MSRTADDAEQNVEPILASLSTICGEHAVRLQQNAEQLLANGQAGAVVVVETADEAQVVAVMKQASQSGWTVKPFGSGTQMPGDACGQPIDIALSTCRMNQVLAYSPEDLVVTAQPGASLAKLQTVLAEQEKMLPLDPWVSKHATLGGITATGISGPRRALYGTVRDMAIALRVVYPDGTVVRTGSKVVKNVAGYDMTKLFVGSRGTLGVITEVTFKLRPLPLHRETVVLTGIAAQVQQVRKRLTASVLIPARAEAMLGFRAESDADEDLWQLAVDCDENALSAAYQTTQLKDWAVEEGMFGEVFHGARADQWWDELRTGIEGAGLRLRVAVAPVQWGALAIGVNQLAAAANVRLQQTWGITSGTGRIFVREASTDSEVRLVTGLRDLVAKVNGSVVIEHAHAAVRQTVDPYGPIGSTAVLFERIKQQVDPGRIMSPATFAGGI